MVVQDEKVHGVISQGQSTNERKQRLRQRFQVVKKLGQGTYGKVQLAINRETKQEVAIKTIKKAKIENEQDLVRIRREIRIMSSIQHPHVIHIYEVFENQEKIVLVMQYASGGELYDYLGCHKKLPEKEARRIFRQMAAAIYYCHKNKICHRDLKLENILLDDKGNAKIADFGLSNVFDEKQKLHTFCGSPLYASPEIVKGTPYCGPEVDCWSLGVLLYTLVYGAMPFDGSNFKRLVRQISEGSYYEPSIKSSASGIIRRLLSVDVSRRANINDICLDEWVNEGYDQSLLTVANDMANLTPGQLDSSPSISFLSNAAVVGRSLFSHLPVAKKNYSLITRNAGQTKQIAERTLPSFVPLVEMQVAGPMRLQTKNGLKFNTEFHSSADGTLNIRQPKEAEVEQATNETLHEVIIVMKAILSRVENINQESNITKAIDGLKNGKIVNAQTNFAYSPHVHSGKTFYIRPISGINSNTQDIQLVCMSESKDNVKQTDPIKNLSSNMTANKDEHKTHLNTKNNLEVCKITLSPKGPALESIQSWKKEHSEKHPENGRTYLTKGNISTEMEISKYGASEIEANITSSINTADQIKLRQDKTEKSKFGQIESDSIVPIFNVSSNIPKRLNGKVHSDYEKELVNEGILQSSTVKNTTAESENNTSNFTTKNETTKFKCANFANVPKNTLLEVNYLQKQTDSEKVAITASSPELLIPVHKSETSVPEKDRIVTDVTNGIASCPKEIISNQQAKQLCLEINEIVLNNHSEESKLSVKNKDCEQQLENKCVSCVQTDYGIKQTNIQTVKGQSQTHMRVFPVEIVSNCNRNGLSPNLDQNLGNEDAATFDVTHGKVDVKCKASVNSNSICLNTKLPNNLNKNNESSPNNNEIQETNIGEKDSKIDVSSYDTASKEEVPLSSENIIYCKATTNDLKLVRDSSRDMILARKNNSELEDIVVNESIQILSNTLSDNINEDSSNSQNSLSDPSSQCFGKHGLRNYPDISKESNPNSRNNIVILGKNTVSDTENDTIILGENISESSTVIKIMEKEPDLNHKISQKPRRYILSRIRAASIEFERIPEWTKKESGSQKKLPGKITIPKYFDETCCLNKSLEKKDIILIPTVSVAENKEKLEKKIEMVKRSALTMKSRRKSDAGTRPKYKKYTRSCTDVLHKLIKCDRTCEAVDFLDTSVIKLNELCNDKDDNFISSSKYQNTEECFDDETPIYDCENRNEMLDCSASNNEQKGYEERFDNYAGAITDGVSYREQHCRSSNKDTTEKETIVNDVHGLHKDTKNSGAKQNGYTPITRCCKKINFPPEQVSKTECENKCMECKDKSNITNDIESETCHLIDDMNTIEKSIESGKCTISNQMQLRTKCKTENQIIQKSERQVSDRDYKREINGESGYNDDNSKNLSSRKCQNTDWLSNYLYDRDSSDNDDELDIMISDSKLDAYGSDSLWKFLKTVNKDINGRLKTLKHARKPLYARSKSQDCQVKDFDNSEKSITRSLSKEDKQQLSLETGMSKYSSEITNKYSVQSQSNLTLDNDNDEHEDLDDSSNSASNLSLPSYKSLESVEKSACCDTYHNASLPAAMKMKRYSLCNLADNNSFPNIRRLQEVNDYDKCKYWRSIQGVDAIDENNVQKNNEMYPQIASPLTQRQSLYGTLRPRKLTKDKRSKSQMQLNGDSDFSSLYSEKKRLFNQSGFKSSDLVHSGMVKNKALSDLDISFTETLYNNAELPSVSYNDALTKNSLRFSTSLGSRLNLDTRAAHIDALKTEAYNNAKENQNCKKPMRRALYSSALDISNPLNSSFLTLPTVRKHQIFNDIKLDTDNKPEISEESGSLLEALKTHGYKSIMSQRLRQTDVNYNETQTSKLSSVGMRGTSNSIGGDFYTVPQYHISANMDPVEYARRMYLNRKLSNPSMDIRDGQIDTMLNTFSNNRIPRKTDFTSGVLPDMWQYQAADELRLTRSLDKRFAFPLCTSNIGGAVNRSHELDSEWENSDLCKINFAQMKNNVENESEFLQDKQDFESKSTENTMEKLSMKIQALKNRCHQKSLDESETSKDTESNTFSSQSINTTFERSTTENEEGINSTIIPDSIPSEKQEQESVSDRIWRKSFYSRFNDLPTLRRRRSTLMDSDFLIDTQSSKSIKRSSVGESTTGERKMVFGREPNNRHTKEERSLNSILMKQSLNESKFDKSLIAEHNIPNHLMDDNAKTDNDVP